MEFSIWQIAVGLLIGLVIGFALRGRTPRQDLTGVPTSLPPRLATTQHGQSPGSLPSAPPQPQAAQDSPEVTPQKMLAVGAALAAGNKIEAIKLLRAATGLGLKESKEAVERMSAP